jgi:hypothetical protein
VEARVVALTNGRFCGAQAEIHINESDLTVIHPIRCQFHIPISALLFLVVPAFFLFVTLQLTKVSGPHWLGSNFENSYPYLFNSLLLVKKQTPQMVAHPGITTQAFGAIILRASVSGRTDRVVKTVLNNPEKFIKRIQRSMLIFAAVCLWIFPWLTAIYIGSYFSGFLVQVPSLFFITLLRYAIWFGSDLMLVPFCIAGICLCIILNHQRWPDKQQQWTLVLAGIVCALGIVTKLTFFPLVFIILACCSGLRNRLRVMVSFAAAAGLALIPIYRKLPELCAWVFGIATHTGFYGSGDVGFVRTDTYLPVIGNVLSAEPMVAWIPMLTTLAIVILSASGRLFGGKTADWTMVWQSLGLFALQLFSFLLVAKHANHHYFIPIDLSVALNLVLLWQFSVGGVRPSLLRIFSVILLIGLVGWSLRDAARKAWGTYSNLHDWAGEQVALYKRVSTKVPSELRIEYYRSPSPRFAECFGDDFAGRYFASFLERKYPRALFYNIFNGMFQSFSDSIPRTEVLARHDRLYFFGNHADYTGIPNFNSTELELIDQGGSFFLDEWKRH